FRPGHRQPVLHPGARRDLHHPEPGRQRGRYLRRHAPDQGDRRRPRPCHPRYRDRRRRGGGEDQRLLRPGQGRQRLVLRRRHKEFENGKVVSTEGTWRAGVDGAQPGIIMEASPKVGDEYDQENAPGVAEDHAKVLSVDASVTVPYGTFDHVLVTEETSPLTPDEIEWKHYA